MNLLFDPPGLQLNKDKVLKKSDFKFIKELGKGAFGIVFEAIHIETKNKLALKEINKNKILEYNMKNQVNIEVKILYDLHHKNIIKLYSHFEDIESIYLVMEFAEKGHLFNLLKKHNRISEQLTCNYVSQIINALYYIHSKPVNPIIHRDLKLENILLMKDGVIKIADFGWSNFIGEKERKTFCGTLEYLAPEMIMNWEHGKEIDIWTLGILIYELLVGKSPFFPKDISKIKSKDELQELIINNIINLKYSFPSFLSRNSKDLIKKILKIEKTERLTLEEIKIHKWFKQLDITFDEFKSYNSKKKLNFDKPGCNLDEAKILVTQGSCLFGLQNKNKKTFINDSKNDIINYTKEIESLNDKISKLNEEIKNHEKILKTKIMLVSEKNRENSELLNNNKKLEEKNKLYKNLNKDLNNDISKIKSELNELKAKNDNKDDLIIKLEHDNCLYKKKFDSLNKKHLNALKNKEDNYNILSQKFEDFKFDILGKNSEFDDKIKKFIFCDELKSILNEFEIFFRDNSWEVVNTLKNLNIEDIKLNNIVKDINKSGMKISIKSEIENEYYEKLIDERKKYKSEVEEIEKDYNNKISILKSENEKLKIMLIK